MLDLIINDDHTDRELLIRVLKGLHTMALDVSKLSVATAANATAISDVSGKVDLLIAAHTDPTGQAAVDAAVSVVNVNTDVVKAVSAKIDAALAPPPPAPTVTEHAA